MLKNKRNNSKTQSTQRTFVNLKHKKSTGFEGNTLLSQVYVNNITKYIK